MADLSDTSGRRITKVKNSDGTTTLKAGKINSHKDANSEAGQYIMHLINDTEGGRYNSITLHRTDGATRSDIGGDVYLNAEQIYGNKEALRKKGLNEKATNVGYTFLHETLHTKFGAFFYIKKNMYLNNLNRDGVFEDPHPSMQDSETGTVVDIINRFRAKKKLPTRYIYGSTPGTLYFESNGNKHIIESTKLPIPKIDD